MLPHNALLVMEGDHTANGLEGKLATKPFRVQAYEATEKWFAVGFLAFVFLQWRLNHAHAKASWHTLADVVRHHRYEHARTLLEH